MDPCTLEQRSSLNPVRQTSCVLQPPPMVGRPSSTSTRLPALAKYAAQVRLLCPAPAITMSNRSLAPASCETPSGVKARGAKAAAPLMKPRRVISTMKAPPACSPAQASDQRKYAIRFPRSFQEGSGKSKQGSSDLVVG